MTSKRAKNKIASSDVYSAVKADFSWFFRRLWQEFSWNHIKCKNNIGIKHICFNVLIFAGCLGRCLSTQPAASCSNSFLGIRQMLMHEKTCVIPILCVFYRPQNQYYIYVERKSPETAWKQWQISHLLFFVFCFVYVFFLFFWSCCLFFFFFCFVLFCFFFLKMSLLHLNQTSLYTLVKQDCWQT